VIHCRDLTKQFESNLAVDRLTFDVKAGEALGLLGPNGAGKTTTSRILACLMHPSSGEAVIDGFKVGTDDESIRRIVGITTEAPGLYERLSALRNLQFFAELYGVNDGAKHIEKYLRMLDLWKRRNDRAGSLSKGMKQKLTLARALVHEPKVLLLDEPTSGLDPQVAQVVREFILQLKSEGRTILLCTHNLDEAERLCDRIAVLKTHLVAIDTPEALRQRLFGRRVVVKLRALDPKFVEAASSLPFVRNVARDTDRLFIQVDDPETNNPDLIRKLVEQGADIQNVTEEQHSLSDTYIRLMGDTPGRSSS
jgi:ABC-2 type transport system ATP-binding protein